MATVTKQRKPFLVAIVMPLHSSIVLRQRNTVLILMSIVLRLTNTVLGLMPTQHSCGAKKLPMPLQIYMSLIRRGEPANPTTVTALRWPYSLGNMAHCGRFNQGITCLPDNNHCFPLIPLHRYLHDNPSSRNIVFDVLFIAYQNRALPDMCRPAHDAREGHRRVRGLEYGIDGFHRVKA